MNMSASKIWNDPNRTKFLLFQNKQRILHQSPQGLVESSEGGRPTFVTRWFHNH